MRSTYWLLVGALVAATVAVALWPSSMQRAAASVPGQYPIDARRPQWSATPSVGKYRPRVKGLQDAIAPTGFVDAKTSCGSVRTLGRGRDPCTLPTVPLGPQYTPTILMN
jgi:hypothetical protein